MTFRNILMTRSSFATLKVAPNPKMEKISSVCHYPVLKCCWQIWASVYSEPCSWHGELQEESVEESGGSKEWAARPLGHLLHEIAVQSSSLWESLWLLFSFLLDAPSLLPLCSPFPGNLSPTASLSEARSQRRSWRKAGVNTAVPTCTRPCQEGNSNGARGVQRPHLCGEAHLTAPREGRPAEAHGLPDAEVKLLRQGYTVPFPKRGGDSGSGFALQYTVAWPK